MNAARASWSLAAVLLALVVGWVVWPEPPPPPLPPLAVPPPEPPPGPDVLTLEIEIRPGTTFGALAMEHGLPLAAVLAAASPHFDLTKVRPDRVLEFVYQDGDELPREIRYQPDEDHGLVLTRTGDAWSGRLDEVVYTSVLGVKDFVVTRSLWADGVAAGIRPNDLVRIARIFEYELDFNTELAPGARIGLVAEILSAEGHTDRLGTIHAVRLMNGSETLEAVRFAPTGRAEEYHHPDGRGLKRPFLRSPLEFSKVTSGFDQRRFHPILKETRPHNGTDLGAPTGTAVRAVADAVVLVAGKNGGHGNYVELDHEGPYKTSYSHLSSVAVKKGQKVRQGDLIGRVGSTGLATGPHLHYQMWQNGKYVDPMTIALPNMSAVTAAERALFDTEVKRWLPMLPKPDGASNEP